MKPNYTFPKTKFVKENTFIEQIIHILSEAEEFRVEATLINSNLQNVLEETVDLYHSIETLFRMCETDGIIQKTIESVLKKNMERGYYDNDQWTSNKDCSPPTLNETQEMISEQCDAIKHMLIEKNKAYGDSCVNPFNVFSKGDPIEQIKVRIDDKLSRIKRGHEYGNEDTELDLIGYLILKRIVEDITEIKEDSL